MRGGWVYIMTNRRDGVLYVGVTADLARRVAQHRAKEGSRFCRKYNLTRLVLAEPYPTIEEAIAREKAMKEWRRAWKIELIEKSNPGVGGCVAAPRGGVGGAGQKGRTSRRPGESRDLLETRRGLENRRGGASRVLPSAGPGFRREDRKGGRVRPLRSCHGFHRVKEPNSESRTNIA